MSDKCEKERTIRARVKWIGLGILLLLLGMISVVVFFAPKHPAALITVVDSLGKPISDVLLTPYGMRAKKVGGAGSGHYGWTADRSEVDPIPVSTDKNGVAIVTYPWFVVERLETEKISIRLSHPEYVSSNTEVTVSSSPPLGAPFKVWMGYYLSRFRKKAFLSHPAPVVLLKGGTLILESDQKGQKLFAQSSSIGSREDGFWNREPSGALMTQKHQIGDHSVRLIARNHQGKIMFSDWLGITVEIGKTNRIKLPLKKGMTVRGELDSSVVRPVVNGVVIVNMSPPIGQTGAHTLMWHSWAPIHEDGTFEFASLPSGELEIVALCQGHISKSGSGNGSTRYPQKHTIVRDDLQIIVDMETTARLEITVLDENGVPLEGAHVNTWPNVRWGNLSTIFGSDCYKTMDHLLSTQTPEPSQRGLLQNGFSGVSNKSGLAVLPNVPVQISVFAVEHENYVLPKMKTAFGRDRRHATMNLSSGLTNRISVTLEPRGLDPVSHY